MNCHDVQPWLVLPEEEIPARLRAEIREHIGTCPACRMESEEHEALILKLRALPVPDPGESFWSGFPERVRKELERTRKESETVGGRQTVKGRRFSPGRFLPLAAAAGIAALALAAVFLFDRIELPRTAFIPNEEDLDVLEEVVDLPFESDDLPELLTWAGANAGNTGYYFNLQELEPENLDRFERGLEEYATSS